MRYQILITGALILMLLAAGCTDEPPPEPVPEDIFPLSLVGGGEDARYIAGDIVAKSPSQGEPLWLILGYDNSTDLYKRTFIFKNADGTWGYRRDTRVDVYPRGDLEKIYPVRVAHVSVASIPIGIPVTVSTTASPDDAPVITGITPNAGARGTTVTITNIAGRYFQPGATVSLIGAGQDTIFATQVKGTSTKITCVFNLIGATTGKRDVVVTNPDGQITKLDDGFTVNEEAPLITSVDPATGSVGKTIAITIQGSNFRSPVKVFFARDGTEIEAANVQVNSVTRITCVLNIPSGSEAGAWDVIVHSVAENQDGTALRMFTITNSTN